MPNYPATPLRIYLSAVSGDADAESEILTRRLPELGIEVILVDPQADLVPSGESWDLARRFEAIESCAFFLAVLADCYGAPTTLPDDLSARYPWLAADHDERSTAELEIRFALASPERSRPKSFFYLRDAQEAKPESESQLAALKEFLRASGRPVFDSYAGPEAFADRVLSDLRAELSAGFPERTRGLSVSDPEEEPSPPANAPQAVEDKKPLPLHSRRSGTAI
jgi:hypothetical protein